MQTHTNQKALSAGDLAGSIVALGLLLASAMWTAWYVLHLPFWEVPPPLSMTAPLLILVEATLLVVLVSRSGLVSLRLRGVLGAGGGLVAALITSLLFGMMLGEVSEGGAVQPGLEGLREDSGLIIAVHLLVGGALGALMGGLSWALSHTKVKGGEGWTLQWRRTLAMVNVLAMLPLVVAGGAVTSSGAGMAVPDWPGTFGANMFVYPFALLDEPRVFFEHTHRLFGTLVGLTSLALMVGCVFSNRRDARLLGIALFVGVCVQGLLGAIRVTDINPGFGVIHGVLAQLLLCLAAYIALRLSSTFAIDPNDVPDSTRDAASRTHAWAIGAFVCVLFQLMLAAMFRHLLAVHALWSHVAFSAIAMLSLVVLASALFRSEGFSAPGRSLRSLGGAVFGVLTLQMVLGFAALGLGSGSFADRGVPLHDDPGLSAPIDTGQVLVATAHQAVGSLLLVMTALAWAWTLRLRKPGPVRGAAAPAG